MAIFWQKLHKIVFCQNGYILAKAAENCVFWPKWFCFGKSCLKLSFNLAKAAQNCVFWSGWLYFGKNCLTLCVLAKMALVWQKLLKDCVFWQKWLQNTLFFAQI